MIESRPPITIPILYTHKTIGFAVIPLSEYIKIQEMRYQVYKISPMTPIDYSFLDVKNEKPTAKIPVYLEFNLIKLRFNCEKSVYLLSLNHENWVYLKQNQKEFPSIQLTV